MAGVQANPNAPVSPPIELQPGWYWYQWPPSDGVIWERVKRESKGTLHLKREWPSSLLREEWGLAVFYLSAPFTWRMRGNPAKAPRGGETVWNDVLAPPTRERTYLEHYVENLEKFINATTEPLANALDKVGSAANFLMWGGVAILLVSVWRRTSP